MPETKPEGVINQPASVGPRWENTHKVPEWRKDAPDIKMMAGSGDEDEAARAKKEAEAAEESRRAQTGGRESGPEGLITSPHDSADVVRGVRGILEIAENDIIRESVEDPYGIRRVAKVMAHRMWSLRQFTMDELEENGYIKNYDPETGTAVPIKDSAANFALKSMIVGNETFYAGYTKNTDGTKEEHFEARPVIGLYFGKEQEHRENLADTDERMLKEMTTRLILHTLDKDVFENNRDALEYLVVTAFLRAPKFKLEHFKELFTMASPEMATEKGEIKPENKEFGKQIEEALMAALCTMRSQTQAKMLDFLSRPGVKAILFKKDPNMPDDQFLEDPLVKKLVGDVKNWTSDEDRKITGDEKDTVLLETKAGKRGLLTNYGNITGTAGVTEHGEINHQEEEGLLGEIAKHIRRGDSRREVEAARKAVDLAVSFARVSGMTADEGAELMADKSFSLELGKNNALTSNDLGKIFHPDIYTLKEYKNGRVFGSLDLVGKTQRMALPFLKLAAADFRGDGAKRSVLDAWLGFPKQEGVLDMVATDLARREDPEAAEVRHNLPAEPHTRLGDLNWNLLQKDTWSGFTQLMWLAGREERGVFEFATISQLKPELFTDKGLRSVRKYTDIVHLPSVLLNGNYRGQAETYDGSKWVQDPKALSQFKKKKTDGILRRWYAGIKALPSFLTDILPAQTSVIDVKAGLKNDYRMRAQSIGFSNRIAARLGFGKNNFDKNSQGAFTSSTEVADIGRNPSQVEKDL